MRQCFLKPQLGLRVDGMPFLPGFREFLETNVRTYCVSLRLNGSSAEFRVSLLTGREQAGQLLSQ